jgi:sigma-54 dependent transcriptional regulator, acetoin dehydrogenase operon transcriptional activator AcoR
LRELRNVLDYAASICVDGPIDVDDLPELQASRLPPARSTAPGLQDAALLHGGGGSDPDAQLQAALRAAQWNVSAVARQMGVARMTLYRRMKRAGIVPPNRMG